MNPIVSKIIKLMKLAQNQEGTPEGETAARIANKLMTAHAVKQEELLEAGEETEDEILYKQSGWRSCNNVWERELYHILCIYMDCKSFYQGPFKPSAYKYTGKYKIGVAGYRSSIEVVEYLYDLCHRQIQDACKAWVKRLKPYKPTQPMRRNFRQSAVYGLSAKLTRMKTDAAQSASDSTAIVLKSRYQRVQDSLKNRKFRKGRSSRGGFSADGYQAGKNINIKAGVNGNNNKRLA